MGILAIDPKSLMAANLIGDEVQSGLGHSGFCLEAGGLAVRAKQAVVCEGTSAGQAEALGRRPLDGQDRE